MTRYFLLVCLWMLIGTVSGQSIRSVARSLERGELDKAKDDLAKSLAKEPRNPGAKYYKSVLLVTPDYQGYHLDSAYYFINQALEDMGSADEKELQKLQRDQVNDSSITAQREHIESLGFEIAQETNTIAGYNLFAKKFPKAREIEEAMSLRNQIAFDEAKAKDSYQEYSRFIQAYPEAKQIPEARSLYDARLFEAKTEGGKLKDYEEFLEEHPNTPFHDQAVAAIFRIKTAGHEIEDYQDFMESYPENKFQDQISDMLYHLYREHHPEIDFSKSGYSTDSIDQTIELEKDRLIAIRKGERFAFINTFGDLVIPSVFDEVPSQYQCSLVQTDYLLIPNGDSKVIYARNGSVAYDQDFESVADMGGGLLKIEIRGKAGVIHKAGHKLLDAEFADVELLGSQFIKVQKDGLWGLRSVTDLELLPIEYDDIQALGEFVVIERNGRMAVSNAAELKLAADQVELDLKFDFDEVELLQDKFLWGFDGDQEALLGLDLQNLVEKGEQEILSIGKYWIVNRENEVLLYDLNFESLSESPLQDFSYNQRWMALEKNGQWALLDLNGPFDPQFQFTLVKLLGEELCLVFQGNRSQALFGQSDTLETTDLTVQVVKPIDPEIHEHLLTTDNKGTKRLYGPNGRKILGGRFDQVAVLTGSLFIIDENGRKGLSDSTGRNVLPINNDAIGAYDQGSVSIVRGGKFGLFHYPSRKVIGPSYSSQLRAYNKRLVVATKAGKAGIVDLNDKTIVDFDYDQLLFWNDTIALAQQGTSWRFLALNEARVDTASFQLLETLDEEEEKTIIYQTSDGIGVLSNVTGQIIEDAFDNMTLIKDLEPIYIAVKSIPQADYYAKVYFGREGQYFWRQAMSAEEFQKSNCEK